MERMHQLLSAVRRVNQVMVRERDPRRLVERACALLVEHSGVEAAWVSLLDEHGRPSTPVGAGLDVDAAGLTEAVVQSPHRLPCMRTALWDTTPGVRLLRAVDCATCPIGTRCARDALAVPLIHAGRAFGVLVVCLPRTDPEASTSWPRIWRWPCTPSTPSSGTARLGARWRGRWPSSAC